MLDAWPAKKRGVIPLFMEFWGLPQRSIASSSNYWSEILLKGADIALSDHRQTYIICESASLPKKRNTSVKR